MKGRKLQRAWFRSSRCVSENHCVEVRQLGFDVGIRNSRKVEDILFFPATEWQEFVNGVRLGIFDSGRRPN